MRRIILMFVANFFRLPYLFYKLFTLCNKEKHSKEERYEFLHKRVRWANKGGRVIIDAHGLENLPKETGYIMFPNHQGLYDVLSMLQVIETPFSTVMKKETQDIYLLKKISQLLDAEIMDREDVRQSLKVIHNMAERVKTGDNFVIFAEGTRSKMGNIPQEFKPGSFKSAMLAKCPIVPIALIDSFIPFDVPSIKKTTVQIHILKPLLYEEYQGMKSAEIALEVSSRIKAVINANCNTQS